MTRHKQELFKGRGGIGGTNWSGWNWRCNATVANSRSNSELRNNPVFNPYPESMTNNVIPRLVIDAHLAQGIPALTMASGAGYIGIEEEDQFDWNMITRPNGWPARLNYSGRWCHSDMKDVAYFFNFKFYDKAVEKGDLR